MRMLVTGATGYIGGRLVPRLLADGHHVRAVARDPGRLRDLPWRADVEVARADVTDPVAVRAALTGVDVAYYLVHAIGTGPQFAERDRLAAHTFAAAAREAGVRRIVYLGGLAPTGASAHLRS
ncbi:MAG TPA: NAD(P)H-binding protein, partial [Micromonosporaceae bacterium]|nr:NAD(P)H-binding protein [Micromonosporaceae bacterium]